MQQRRRPSRWSPPSPPSRRLDISPEPTVLWSPPPVQNFSDQPSGHNLRWSPPPQWILNHAETSPQFGPQNQINPDLFHNFDSPQFDGFAGQTLQHCEREQQDKDFRQFQHSEEKYTSNWQNSPQSAEIFNINNNNNIALVCFQNVNSPMVGEIENFQGFRPENDSANPFEMEMPAFPNNAFDKEQNHFECRDREDCYNDFNQPTLPPPAFFNVSNMPRNDNGFQNQNFGLGPVTPFFDVDERAPALLPTPPQGRIIKQAHRRYTHAPESPSFQRTTPKSNHETWNARMYETYRNGEAESPYWFHSADCENTDHQESSRKRKREPYYATLDPSNGSWMTASGMNLASPSGPPSHKPRLDPMLGPGPWVGENNPTFPGIPKTPEKLYHYTTWEGIVGIFHDRFIRLNDKSITRYGFGIYFTDIPPERSTEEIVYNNYNNLKQSKFCRTEYCLEFLSADLPELSFCTERSWHFAQSKGRKDRNVWKSQVHRLYLNGTKGTYYLRDLNGLKTPKSVERFTWEL